MGLLVNGGSDLVTADASIKGEDTRSLLYLSLHCPGLSGWCAWSRVRGDTSSGNGLSRRSSLKVRVVREIPGTEERLLPGPSSERARRGIKSWSASLQLLGRSWSKPSWKQFPVTWRRRWWLEIARMDLLRVNHIWLTCLHSVIKWLVLKMCVEQRMFSSLTVESLLTLPPRASLYPSWDVVLQMDRLPAERKTGWITGLKE